MRFRKRPEEVDAVKWEGRNVTEITALIGSGAIGPVLGDKITIFTVQGMRDASIGDWILQDSDGGVRVIGESIFKRTYEHIRTYPHERPAGGLRPDDS